MGFDFFSGEFIRWKKVGDDDFTNHNSAWAGQTSGSSVDDFLMADYTDLYELLR